MNAKIAGISITQMLVVAVIAGAVVYASNNDLPLIGTVVRRTIG